MPRKKPIPPDHAKGIAKMEAVLLDVTVTDTRVSVRPVKGRKLITIEPDHVLWKPGRHAYAPSPGSIVRLRPPDDATDSEVEAARAACDKWAERVTVLPRRRKEAVPQRAKAARNKATGARQAVEQLVRETNSQDREALAELCEEAMTKEGL